MVTVFGTFDHDTGIQIMLISEFGHMFEKMSNVEEIFTTMLAELDLTHVRFEAMPPYAALMDKTAWQVTKTDVFPTHTSHSARRQGSSWFRPECKNIAFSCRHETSGLHAHI